MSKALQHASNNGEMTLESIERVKANLANPLQKLKVTQTALFHANNELVLVVDNNGDTSAGNGAQIMNAIGDTSLRVMLCSKGTGCIDLKAPDPVMALTSEGTEIAEDIRSQAEDCLRSSLPAGVSITGLFDLNGKLMLVVDDGEEKGALDAQIIAAIGGCAGVSAIPLQVVRCSKGTGCIDLRVS